MPATTTAPVPSMSSLKESRSLTVAGQHAERVPVREILPLDERARKDLANRLHQLVHQGVVGGAPQATVRHAQVERIGQQRLVVGAHVEIDRKAARRVNSGARGVERELADRDPHAAHALVADAEDRLVVGDHDDADVLFGSVPEHVADPPSVLRRDVEPARTAVDVAEVLADLSNGRRVDDGDHLLEVIDEEAVEEGFVPVLERGQEEVALHVVARALVVLVRAGALLLFGRDARGQETAEPECVALVFGEARPLVEERIVLNRLAAAGYGPVGLPRDRVRPLLKPPHGSSIRLPPGGLATGTKVAPPDHRMAPSLPAIRRRSPIWPMW